MAAVTGTTSETYLLDYGAGNVLSVVNAVRAVGGELKLITCVEDFDKVRTLRSSTALPTAPCGRAVHA